MSDRFPFFKAVEPERQDQGSRGRKYWTPRSYKLFTHVGCGKMFQPTSRPAPNTMIVSSMNFS